MRFFVVLLLLWNCLNAKLSTKNIEFLNYEMNKIPLRYFSRSNILNQHKGDLKCAILVEIKDNKLFVNNEMISEDFANKIKWLDEVKEACLTFYKLIQARKIPDVLFLYTKKSKNLDHLKDKKILAPVLLGTNNVLYSKHPFVTFIESFTLSFSFFNDSVVRESFKNPLGWGETINRKYDYSWEYVHESVLLSQDLCPWEQKRPVLFWRGALTDNLVENKYFDFLVGDQIKKLTSRGIIHCLSLQHPDCLDCYLFHIYTSAPIPMKTLRSSASLCEHLFYKYQIVMDGIHCTNPGYAWRLMSGCCTLKLDSPQFQWFYVNLEPWVHYIPVKEDLSDLVDTVHFLQEHDDVAKGCAMRSLDFALNHLSPDDFLDFAQYVLEKYAERQNYRRMK